MRGVNLSVFDFDYDLTWMAFFLSADEQVYGRYGGRDAQSADARLSLAGLRSAMAAALVAHRKSQSATATSQPPSLRTIEQYPAARRRQTASCIHCHHVYEFQREALQAEGVWQPEQVWVYPLPENVGLSLDVDNGARVRAVAEASPACRAGLKAGDRLRQVNDVPVASSADVQYGLHRARTQANIPVAWLHNGSARTGMLHVTDGWRQTDVSWRWSLRALEPSPWVRGEDLSAAEKQKVGLSERQLAFYQGDFVSDPARQAGIRHKDIILGIDGKQLELTAQQFSVYVKLHYKVGDRVTYNLLRDGKRVDIPMTLVRRPPF
jgi:predicted metalloprotease with PDZ domain